MVKRILDALKGIVFHDDDQIVRCLTQKTVTSSRSFSIDVSDVPSEAVQTEILTLMGTERHFLYIEVGAVTDPTISFGPVR